MRVIACALAILTTVSASPVRASEGRLVHAVRFTDYEQGSVEDWLPSKGFQVQEDARRRNRIDLDVDEFRLAAAPAAHRA